MDRRKGKRVAIERIKNILIILLSCSAILLALRVLQPLVLSKLLDQSNGGGNGEITGDTRNSTIYPLRLAAVLKSENVALRYGVKYDTQSSDAIYQQVESLLQEMLNTAQAPSEITEPQWKETLLAAPNLVLDFQGDIPLQALSGWRAQSNQALAGTARLVVLSGVEGHMTLYYQDVTDGKFYTCVTGVENTNQLDSALADQVDNGAFYAFESEKFQNTAPYTLLLPGIPMPKSYTAGNPLTNTQEALTQLLTSIGLPVESTSFYPSGDEQVARNSGERLSLSKSGTLLYTCDADTTGHYVISGSGSVGMFQMVEACQSLAQNAVAARAGAARLYLSGVEETDEGWLVTFSYSLNGIPVQLEMGPAAQFLVSNGRILQFTMNFRIYTDSGQTTLLLPQQQAAAAMEAMGYSGDELVLVYPDQGGDMLAATWAASEMGNSLEKGR